MSAISPGGRLRARTYESGADICEEEGFAPAIAAPRRGLAWKIEDAPDFKSGASLFGDFRSGFGRRFRYSRELELRSEGDKPISPSVGISSFRISVVRDDA